MLGVVIFLQLRPPGFRLLLDFQNALFFSQFVFPDFIFDPGKTIKNGDSLVFRHRKIFPHVLCNRHDHASSCATGSRGNAKSSWKRPATVKVTAPVLHLAIM